MASRRELCLLGLVVAAVTATIAVESVAAADPRIVVLEFDPTKRGRALRGAVAGLLTEQQFTVIEVTTAGTTADIASKVAAEVIVTGRVRRERKRFILTLTIAGTDKPAAVVDLGRSGTFTKSVATVIRRDLVARLKATDPPAEAVPPPPVIVAPEPAPMPPAPPPPPPETAITPQQQEAVNTLLALAQAPTIAEAAATAAAQTPPPRAPAFRNFAPVRSALQRSEVALRGYWDSRHLGALEQYIALRAPLDLALLARTTLRSEGGQDLSTFGLTADLLSPMLFSVGAIVNIGGGAGSDNDAVRPGIAQSLAFERGPLRMSSILAFLVFDSRQPGGRINWQLNLHAGRLSSELVASYQYAALGKLADPAMIYLRPDLRLRIWKGFGIYGQYELNTAADDQGVRIGIEVGATL